MYPYELATLITKLKRAYVSSRDFNGFPYEILPLDGLCMDKRDYFPISKLNEFADHNPIFHNYKEISVQNCRCRVFSCEVINYWLSSKKYDTCYQPFYPTWLISSLIICIVVKSLGFTEIVDIGSGDARVPYSGAIVGLRGISVELDTDLVGLQEKIISSTGVDFEIVSGDACEAKFEGMNLARPMFLISGLPEQGEILAEAVMNKLIHHELLSSDSGLALMGSHTMKQFSRDRRLYGWGSFIAEHNLRLLDCLTLPTMWTNDQPVDTPFVFSKLQAKY